MVLAEELAEETLSWNGALGNSLTFLPSLSFATCVHNSSMRAGRDGIPKQQV